MDAITQRYTHVFVQTQPGFDLVYLGECITIDNLPDPRSGIELIQCHNRGGTGYEVIGHSLTPPGTIDFTLTELLGSAASYLEDLHCMFAVYVLQRDCGDAGIPTNWVRGAVVGNARITDDTLTSPAARDSDEAIGRDFAISAYPGRINVRALEAARETTTQANALNFVWSTQDPNCGGASCGPYEESGEFAFAGADDDGVGGTADVEFTFDNGTTWTAGATDPFAAGEVVLTGVRVETGAGTHRIIVARDGDAAAALEIAYSDDDGATWTNVTVGNTNNEAATGPKSMFALDMNHIWLATDQGNIFFSDDGGITWTDQGASTASGANALNAISFADHLVGYAVGAADTVIYTLDGGDHWVAGTATGSGDDILAVACFDRYRVIVGTDDVAGNGSLWQTWDGSANWTSQTFIGSGAEEVADIHFMNDYVGMIVTNTSGPVGSVHRTIDGGKNWIEVTTVPTNSGLNSVWMIDNNNAFVVGEVNGGTAVILSIYG